jgi:beta-phosphoglucomutase
MKTAFLFDLNGTMIDDMEYHVRAWTEILNQDLKANLSDMAIRGQMYGKNSELFDRVFGPARYSPEEVDHWSLEKEKRYQQAFRPHLELIKGLDRFLKDAREHGVTLAIGTAAIPFNVNFVLDNLDIASYFQAIVTADDVKVSKPDPEVYLRCAELVGADPTHCVVFEDAPKGVEAAQNAGMKAVVVLSTLHGMEDFKSYTNILAYIHDYTEITPEEVEMLNNK